MYVALFICRNRGVLISFNAQHTNETSNARIFREIKSQDGKFPDRIFQDGKFWDQKIPGIPIFHGIQEFFYEKIPGFFSLEGRKFQDFWLHLFPGLKIQ